MVSLKWMDGSYLVSDIQDYIEPVMKTMKHYPPILLSMFTSIGLTVD